MKSSIHALYEKMRLELHADPQLEHALHVELAKIVARGINQSMNSDEGYCFRFNLPLVAVNRLIKYMGLTKEEIYDGFKKAWGADAMTHHMYSDSYYQILLLIIYYGMREKKPQFTENALLITMFKLWNGRKTKYLQICDKRIMRYVVSNMCTNKHLFSKYDDPLAMLQQYFVPTIIKKYEPEILKASNPDMKIQRLFSQAWGRLNQQWARNMRLDIKTGKKIAQGGILPMYQKAREDGEAIGTLSVKKQPDTEITFDEYNTTNNRDEIITTTCEYITMNPNPKYPQSFIKTINIETKVSAKVIEKILKSLHNYKYYDFIHDICSVILSSTGITNRNQICQHQYDALIKKKVIISKNSIDSKKLQKILNKLLVLLFKHNMGDIKFTNYSNVQQIQLRTVIIRGIVYNLKRRQCRGG